MIQASTITRAKSYAKTLVGKPFDNYRAEFKYHVGGGVSVRVWNGGRFTPRHFGECGEVIYSDRFGWDEMVIRAPKQWAAQVNANVKAMEQFWIDNN